MKPPLVVDKQHQVVLNEMFGPTFQGEGPSTGQLARFIRLFGCHLSCSWCDSGQTHDASRYDLSTEQTVTHLDDILARLEAAPPALVVITGGEPLLQQEFLCRLCQEVQSSGLATAIEIETSGTLAPTDELISATTRFNVSPKLANSGLHLHQRIRPTALRRLTATNKAIWKFVVQSIDDLSEIDELVNDFQLQPIWVMPEGTDSTTILTGMRSLADPVLARGWNLSSRLHTLLWENDRGR